MTGMVEPLRVACIGMGWWSDVLADAMKRSDKLKIVACYTRSAEKRDKFAAKYRCRPAEKPRKAATATAAVPAMTYVIVSLLIGLQFYARSR